ncbi:MAG: hypothetical protein ACM34L_04915 [Gemmatimonas sp.]
MSTLLLQGAATAADSMVVRPAATGPGWYVIFTQVTTAASVVVFLVLMLVLIPALLKFRKTAEKLDTVLDHLERNIDPVTKHATHIADNVDYISTSIRADVQEIRTTLLAANAGIREMIDASERRLHELSAVLRVVQEEAEHAFVSTASTIRGVRAGATTFRGNGARLAEEEEEELEDLEDVENLEEVDDDEFSDARAHSDELEDIDEDEERIDTINDLDAAGDAAEDMTNGDDNGSALGRAEPRIKRARRRDRR